MYENNIGYACINMELASQSPKIYTGRSMIKKTFISKGIPYASKLGLQNTKDLFKILKWNKKNDFNFFRITSNLFPWCSEYELEEMPDYNEISSLLSQMGTFVNRNKIRVTFHPGPFNVLTSKNEKVVENCINDLSIHAKIFDLMNLKPSTYNKINIHIGGVYGDKASALKRFCVNFKKLPNSVQKRLTVENDDKSSMYSVEDLYFGVYKIINIPIVFDYHHHRFCNGGMTEKSALELAISTWGDVTPVVHYSESRNVEQNDNKIKPQAHSDYIYQFIDTYGYKVDIMIEAKAKEKAVRKYQSIYNL